MSNFFTLVKYEFKKIFKARINTILIILTLFMAIITVVLNANGGNYYSGIGNDMSKIDALKMDIEIINEKAGLVDDAILKEMIIHIKEGVSNEDNYFETSYGDVVLKSDFNLSYILPYYNIYYFLEDVFDEDIENLNPEDMNGFYTSYKAILTDNININQLLSDTEKQKHIEMIEEIETPFYNEYFGSFKTFTMMILMLGILILILVTVVSANVFGNEFHCKTDGIILSSKNGKRSLILAKMVTVVIFSALASLMIIGVNIFCFIFTHGLGGLDCPIQFLSGFAFSTYPITIGECILISIPVFTMVSIAFGCFGAMVSTIFKNPIATISSLFILVFFPLFIPSQTILMDQILNLAPLRIFNYKTMFSNYFYNFGTISFTPYVFFLIASFIGMLMFFAVSYRNFKHHQVS